MEAIRVQIGLAEHIVGDESGAGHDIAGRFAGGGCQRYSQSVGVQDAQVAGIGGAAAFSGCGAGTAIAQGAGDGLGMGGDVFRREKSRAGLGRGLGGEKPLQRWPRPVRCRHDFV